MSTAPRIRGDPRHQGAYPRLSDDALAALADQGTRRTTAAGELLFRDGDEGYDFFVVLSGQVAIVADIGGPQERVIGVHGARRFLGELNLLTAEGGYLTARVVEPGEVIQISADRLTQIVAGQAGLGDLILGTRRGRQPSFWRAIAGKSCSWFGATASPRRCRAT